MAVKAARDKAAYLTEAVNEQVGQAITIEEPGESVVSDAFQAGRSGNNVMLDNVRFKMAEGDASGGMDGSVDFRKIRLRFEVKVLYAIK